MMLLSTKPSPYRAATHRRSSESSSWDQGAFFFSRRRGIGFPNTAVKSCGKQAKVLRSRSASNEGVTRALRLHPRARKPPARERQPPIHTHMEPCLHDYLSCVRRGAVRP